MKDKRQYNREDQGELGKDWMPHKDVSDIWHLQGVLREPEFPQAVYPFRLTISKIIYPFDSFYALQFSLGETLNDIDHHERMIIPLIKGKKNHIAFDHESFFFGEAAQVLNTEKAYVLRLRGKDFGLDLRLDKKIPVVWHGDNGKIELTKTKRENEFLTGCSRSQLQAFGRLYIGDRDFHVEGISSLERIWGHIPYKKANMQWERFYLFFSNQDELMLMDFPLGTHKEGTFIPHRGEAQHINDFHIEPIDFLEIEDWRFASLWQIDIPKINKGPFYLIPLIKSQICLPIARPFVGIYDKDGVNYGYGHAELYPGVRNELLKIPLSVYKRYVSE